ncbi:MAG: Zn-ribbon domain-containing OB-fold protein [Deltaproteobacteria bacterium]|nr:Zn-ribbon domain-containing OB-fold protein [Deltaproteobacteria bacterium]
MKRARSRITETRTWLGEIPIRSRYTAGVAGQLFLTALKERGELIGTRCAACSQVYVPARQFCERCFAELTETVKLKPEGTLKSFTIGFVDHDGKRLKKALALALVQLDGATTVFFHRLLDATDPSKVRIGSPVQVVIKPKTKRTGSILDIEGFKIKV